MLQIKPCRDAGRGWKDPRLDSPFGLGLLASWLLPFMRREQNWALSHLWKCRACCWPHCGTELPSTGPSALQRHSKSQQTLWANGGRFGPQGAVSPFMGQGPGKAVKQGLGLGLLVLSSHCPS